MLTSRSTTPPPTHPNATPNGPGRRPSSRPPRALRRTSTSTQRSSRHGQRHVATDADKHIDTETMKKNAIIPTLKETAFATEKISITTASAARRR